MKKTVVCMLIAAMTMGSMVTPVFADGEGDATHIYVLTAPEDHGWTGSVATFAKEKILCYNAGKGGQKICDVKNTI